MRTVTYFRSFSSTVAVVAACLSLGVGGAHADVGTSAPSVTTPSTTAPTTTTPPPTTPPTTTPPSTTPPSSSTQPSTPASTETSTPTDPVAYGSVTINAVLDGAHDGVNGVLVRLVAVNPYVTTLPATVQSASGTVSVLVLEVPEGLALVGPSSFNIPLERGRDTFYMIHLSAKGTSAPGTTNPGTTAPERDPGARTPLSSIPSGPVDRP